MPTNSIRHRTLGAASSAALGLLLVGTVAVVPARADSFRSQQWHLDAMKADQMWKSSTGKGVTVAVIDSGVDADHPDLRGQVLRGEDLASTSAPGDEHTDYDGHGTGIAGMIAGTGTGNGGNGAYGLAPGTKILPIRLPDAEKAANGAESDEWTLKGAAKGIRYAADHGAKVVNISQAATGETPELTAAVKYALDKGVLIFAGVGNDGNTTNLVQYPAATPGVVGVAAIDENGRRTKESNYGPQVDIAAPGMDIVHACGGKTGYCKSHGTSDATALASASAALIWSKHPTWTNNQVLRVILNTIGGVKDDKGKRSDFVGYGAVRPRIALTNPGDPGPAGKFPMSDYPVAAKSPSDEASKATGAQTSDGDHGATSAAESKSSSSGLWIGVGIAVVVVIIGAGVAVAGVRRRNRNNQQLPPPPAPTQPPYPGVSRPGSPHGAPQPYRSQQFTDQQQPYGPAAPGSSSGTPYSGS